jgi:hexosaminidase
MKLNFMGETDELMEGIRILEEELSFQSAGDGFPVHVQQLPAGPLKVERTADHATITYTKKIHFFRALGLLLEHFDEQNKFEVTEEPQFATNGVMLDVCQGNAVINVPNIKKLLKKMSVMGLNMMMLYCEDSYDVKEEPYFGYMRGRYSEEELRECDRFADQLGIEMIPCMQTLAHLIDVLKWDRYSDMKDDDDTLLVGYEPTYEFIERIIQAASTPFKTNRIHIGMDEAWKLGQGNYLLRNGYRDKADIMNEHLERVMGIVTKLGLEPMIWSDMYFRAASPTGDYYDLTSTVSKETIEGAPKNLQLVYWDYNHHEEGTYVEMIRRHKAFGSTPLFAGGIWGWNGFTVDYEKTFLTTNAALQACKAEGVQEVFATIWGDGGVESNIYAHLLGLQLFAEHGYSRQLERDKLNRRFKFCVRGNVDDFFEMTYLDKLPGMESKVGYRYTNPSKYLMWQDPLAGLFDKNIEGLGMKEHYSGLAMSMRQKAEANPDWRFLFEFLGKTASTLSLKAELGIQIYQAYQDDDKSALRSITDSVIPALIEQAGDLRKTHRHLWMETNKPLGWEVLDIRYGGMLARLDTTSQRIADFLEGRVEKIDELEQDRLYFSGQPGLVSCNVYTKMASASRLSFSLGF